ncbi:auxin-responsive protein iaa26 [Quercus suber]|uniref:Auxin-responsive protein n=1 Tax=Quercus suber TaxID=58331 RepID=A0AAW0II03_QUESU
MRDAINGVSEEKKLELRLVPPGEAQSIHYVGFNNKINGAKRVWQRKKRESGCQKMLKINQYQDLSFTEKTVERVFPTPWSSASLYSSAFHLDTQKQNQQPKPTYIQYPSISRRLNRSHNRRGCRVAEMQNSDKKACFSRPASASVSTATAEPINSQKSPVVSRDISMKYVYQDQILISLPIDAPTKSRIAVAPVVGWPSILSFRKNLGSRNFSKPAPKSPNETPKEGSDGEKLVNLEHHMFAKINMDGVPIGRKVDLKAYDNYSAATKENKVGDAKAITDSLHGSREYTLICEDNEGDRMLVGDVPWQFLEIVT